MKKILSLICLLLLSITLNTNAESVSTFGYSTPIYDQNLKTEAILKNSNSVYISWKAFDNSKVKFKYYKVVKSQKVENPVYPDDGYITAISDITTTSFLDTKLVSGINYYRICAITSEAYRYCGNTVKINVEKETQVACTRDYNPVCGKMNGVEKTFGNKCTLLAEKATYSYAGECRVKEESVACTLDYNPVCGKINGVEKTFGNKCTLLAEKATYSYAGECRVKEVAKEENGLNYSMQLKTDTVIKKFIIKVETIYSDNSKRIYVLNTVIEKLNNLNSKNANQKLIIEYIIESLKKKIESYNGDDLSDIENIFNEIQ